MNFLFPIFAAVLQAGSFVLDKAILSIKRVTFKTYTGISFPLYFVATLIIFLIFRTPIHASFFYGWPGLLLAISVGVTIISNLVYYRALDHDRLSELQTLELIAILPVIIFSGIIFTDERDFSILIPALVAASAVIWSHWENHHFKINKTTLPFFIWAMVIAPVTASISKILLQTWNPISLEVVRTGILALVFGYLFYRNMKTASPKAFYLMILTNALSAVAWILFYFSYQRLGIVYTLLIFSLEPMLVYFSSLFILKERVNNKKIFAFFIILMAIIVANVI